MHLLRTKRIVTAGLMLAIGILLPMVTAHGYGIKGTVLLPMHLPVFVCGFCCGPLYGGLCGLILPVLNSMLTGMPTLFPNALIMTGELGTYGFISGLLYQKSGFCKKYLYPILLAAMAAGRIVYGLLGSLLLLFDPNLGTFSVIAALVTGIPGIVIQVILIPNIVALLRKALESEVNVFATAKELVQSGAKTCVVVRGNKIISSESPQGIKHIIELHDQGILKDSLVADKIIGKSAAMVYTLSGVKACHGITVSESAVQWLQDHGVAVTYDTLVSVIQNRRGDGMCPMEATVLNCWDAQEALQLLKNKINS